MYDRACANSQKYAQALFNEKMTSGGGRKIDVDDYKVEYLANHRQYICICMHVYVYINIYI